jgi:hypothetical protein
MGRMNLGARDIEFWIIFVIENSIKSSKFEWKLDFKIGLPFNMTMYIQ